MDQQSAIEGSKDTFIERLKGFVEGHQFNAFIILTIVVNAILLGLETSPDIMHACGAVVSFLSDMCVLVFVIEAVLKLAVYRHRYFASGWNVFDFLILAVTLVPAGGSVSALRVMRVMRVFRSLKLVSAVGRLRIIVQAILVSIPSVMWTGLLLMIFFYIYGLVGQNIFGEKFPDWFGTIGASIYTLFQVMTLESWSMGIARPVMEEFSWAWIYFVSFVLISSYTVINVIVGIVVNAVSEISEADKQRRYEALASGEDDDRNAMIKRHQQTIEKLKSAVADLEEQLHRM